MKKEEFVELAHVSDNGVEQLGHFFINCSFEVYEECLKRGSCSRCNNSADLDCSYCSNQQLPASIVLLVGYMRAPNLLDVTCI